MSSNSKVREGFEYRPCPTGPPLLSRAAGALPSAPAGGGSLEDLQELRAEDSALAE